MIALGIAAGLMFVAWLVYRATDKASWVDAFWAGNLAVLALWYAWVMPGDISRRALVAVVGGLWGLRLAVHIARRVASGPEDPRYLTLRAEWKTDLSARFLRFFMIQAVVDVALSVPFLLMARDASPFGRATEIAGLVLWALSLTGESVADAQLAHFKRDAGNRGHVCRDGLWSVSRHPNYFFEWLVWCAFALMATGAPWGWVSWSAPALMLYFLLRVTGIPLTEQQSLKSKGKSYARYQREVAAFVPWLRWEKKL